MGSGADVYYRGPERWRIESPIAGNIGSPSPKPNEPECPDEIILNV